MEKVVGNRDQRKDVENDEKHDRRMYHTCYKYDAGWGNIDVNISQESCKGVHVITTYAQATYQRLDITGVHS